MTLGDIITISIILIVLIPAAIVWGFHEVKDILQDISNKLNKKPPKKNTLVESVRDDDDSEPKN